MSNICSQHSETLGKYIKSYSETFDISGKVDTNNPIYKFYEKEVAKYLRNNFDAKTITDDKGVTWNQVDLKEKHRLPVEAFGLIGAVGTGLLSNRESKEAD